MRFAALDTRFLLALAGGELDAEATIDYLQRNGFSPIITECVFEQLGELQHDPTNPAHDAAAIACKNLVTWGIYDPSNKYVDNGTSCVHAEKIMDQGLIPEATRLEAEMLVEASCHNCELFVTFSQPLLNAPSSELNLALIESGLVKVTVTIASPEMIADRLTILNAQATIEN
jgi:rRNA-processing protein FCF1